MKLKSNLILFISVLLATACSQSSSLFSSEQSSFIVSSSSITQSTSKSSSLEKSSSSSSSISSSKTIKDNVLSNENGLEVTFSSKGAKVSKITYNGLSIAKDGFTVGRVANRIANGKFKIDDKEYNVTKNVPPHSLHGGGSSWQGPFANATWTKDSQTEDTITFSLHSKDGDDGYPGNMDMKVIYTLTNEGELRIEYKATSDKDTLCNPTNHLYISINGNTSYSNTSLWVNAASYTPLSNQIPTGEIASVTGTKFDYSTKKAFDGSKDYDDNYVLDGEGYRKVASLEGSSSKIKVDVYTDRPGMQLYKAGQGQICLETQMFPDAINQPNFESPILRAGQQFSSKTSYIFTSIK